MRSDYMLYTVAIIFFILTSIVAAYYVEQQLWIVTTAVLGLVFIGLGYSQRPRPTAPTTATPPTMTTPTTVPPPPAPPVQPATTEILKKEEKTEPVVEALPTRPGLTELKGIKEKRAAQLKTLGINSIEDLAKASADDLAAKLQISPKITVKWIENAKEILAKT